MFKKLSIYSTLNECPVWNWDMTSNKNDLRYLYILDNYSKLPKLNNISRHALMVAYRDLYLQFENMKNPLIAAKKKIIGRVLDLVKAIAQESNDIDKIEEAKILLKALIITPDPDIGWMEREKFTETPKQKQLKAMLMVEINKYNAIKSNVSSKKKQTLYEQVAKIETILGVNIDVMTCSVLQFVAYQNETTELVKKQSHG